MLGTVKDRYKGEPIEDAPQFCWCQLTGIRCFWGTKEIDCATCNVPIVKAINDLAEMFYADLKWSGGLKEEEE